MSAEKTGKELVDEAAAEPNLDRFFDRNPNELSDDELSMLIDIERGKRSLFIEKKKG